MPEGPQPDKSQLIHSKGLAEEMAYAEKPYQDIRPQLEALGQPELLAGLDKMSKAAAEQARMDYGPVSPLPSEDVSRELHEALEREEALRIAFAQDPENEELKNQLSLAHREVEYLKIRHEH